MNKVRTIIHIGQHKTATTSIQHYLRSKRIELAKQGLYVPDSLIGYDDPSHYILNVYALNHNRFSSMKTELLKTRTSKFFKKLKQNIEKDISAHYQNAANNKCNDVIWSNEGLYLLNSAEEYQRLLDLFDKYSLEVVCVCCFRDPNSYRESYMQQLRNQNIDFSNDKDSYRYIESDSWLFDYQRKNTLLMQAFEKVITIPYDQEDMVQTFMAQIGYPQSDTDFDRLNVTKYR